MKNKFVLSVFCIIGLGLAVSAFGAQRMVIAEFPYSEG
jgi:hypothetical protein